jgi:Fe-S-cluster containining protein
MVPDLVQIRTLAQKKEEENLRFRQFLKFHCNLNEKDLDERVFNVTRRVWANIDCTTCANCCREVNPTFSEEEVSRLAHRLGMTPQRFIDTYLERTEAGVENPWQTRTKPCPFLQDNRCSVYDERPANCQGYPYLYEPEFTSRLWGMIGRTFTCPIVYEVMEELKKSLRFSRKRSR